MANRLYLLDTNSIIIYAQRGHANVRKRMREVEQSNLIVSSLVAAELAHGVEKSTHKDKAALESLLSVFYVAPWDASPMWKYAENFHRLRSSGAPIGEMDLLIGYHALALNALCVTNNIREFERIEGLKLENWAD